MGVHYEAPKIVERVELTGLLSDHGNGESKEGDFVHPPWHHHDGHHES